MFYVSNCLWGFCVGLCFGISLLCVLSSFAIILTRKRELIALLLLCFKCLVTVNVLCFFLTVPWVGLQCVIVVFPDHTHFLYDSIKIVKICQDSQPYSFVPFSGLLLAFLFYKYKTTNRKCL